MAAILKTEMKSSRISETMFDAFAGADIQSEQTIDKDIVNRNVLHYVALSRTFNRSNFEKFVRCYKLQDKDGNTPLHTAVLCNNTEFLRLCVEKDLTVIDFPEPQSSLSLSMTIGSLYSTVSPLSQTVQSPKPIMQSLLMFAVKCDQAECVSILAQH